jgi:hypothetical protein
MNFPAKRDAALRLLASNGVSRFWSTPPLFWLFWRIGIKLPPPLFLGFFGSFMLSGVSTFLIFFGLSFAYSEGELTEALALSFIAGIKGALVFGLLGAVLSRWRARNRGIPLWRDFKPPVQ